MERKLKVLALFVYTLKDIIDSIMFYGTYTVDIFADFIIKNLLSIMNPFPIKHSIIVMDNAEIHHIYIQYIKNAYYVKGVVVLCLPLYSLDFNPIESFFSVFKSYIKRTYKEKKSEFPDY